MNEESDHGSMTAFENLLRKQSLNCDEYYKYSWFQIKCLEFGGTL
jgi:hypothetical protein